jgi:hypothetical protein
MLRQYVPGLSGVSENGSAAANTLGFAAIEASKPGEAIDLQGRVYPVSSLPNGAQYYNGAFEVSGDVIWMPRNPLAHPFEGASMMIVNPIMRDYQGSALFWQKPNDPAHWIMAWRESVQHGINNGTRIVCAETWDRMRRPISDYTDKKLVYTDANNDATIHCPATMANGRLGFIARIENAAGTYSDPKFFYSDDNGATWSNSAINTTLDTTPYGDMLPYPASVGGHDTQGFIWYYYQSTRSHAVYTVDNGANWTEVTNVALRGDTAAVQEASVVRIGNLNRWVMFSRNTGNIGVHLSTDMLTWGDAVYGDLYLGGNPPHAFYEGGYIWVLAASRENNAILTEHENALLIARIDPTRLWNSGGTEGFSGWQVISSAAFWPMSYFTVRKIRDRYYAFGQLMEGHTAGGSTSRTSCLALLSRDAVEQAPIQQTLLSIPQPNLIVDGEFKIWPRGTSVTGTTRKNVTPAARFSRSSAVGGWTISRQTGSKSQYCMRIRRDDGNAGTQAMSLNFTLTTPDSVAAALNSEFVNASFRARKGSGYSATDSKLNIQFRQTATGDQVTTGNTGVFVTGDTTVATAVSTITLGTDWQDFEYAVGPIASTTQQILLHLTYTPVGTASEDWYELEMVKIEYGYNKTPFVRKPFAQVQAEADRWMQSFTVRSINGTIWVPFSCVMQRVPEVTLSAGSAANISTAGFELTHTSAATITVEADAGL